MVTATTTFVPLPSPLLRHPLKLDPIVFNCTKCAHKIYGEYFLPVIHGKRQCYCKACEDARLKKRQQPGFMEFVEEVDLQERPNRPILY